MPIHQKNFQKSAIEMFKTYTGMAPQIMNEIFPRNYTLNYNLHRHPEFESRAINTAHYGPELLSFLGPKIWEMLPLDLKNSDSVDSFKSGIKTGDHKNVLVGFVKGIFTKYALHEYQNDSGS